MEDIKPVNSLERKHYILGGLLIALAFALQPFALLFTQIYIAPMMIPSMADQNQEGSTSANGKSISTEGMKLRGSPNAQLVLVEFSDYECPFCGRFHNTPKEILAKYGDKISWDWKHFPLPFHQNAKPAAIAAECVNKLSGVENFWKYSDTLIANQQKLSDSLFKSEATKLGVNAAQFATCLQDKEIEAKIDKDTAEGSELGVNGTPNTFIAKYVDGKLEIVDSINGALPTETVEKMVEKYLQ